MISDILKLLVKNKVIFHMTVIGSEEVLLNMGFPKGIRMLAYDEGVNSILLVFNGKYYNQSFLSFDKKAVTLVIAIDKLYTIIVPYSSIQTIGLTNPNLVTSPNKSVEAKIDELMNDALVFAHTTKKSDFN